MPRNYLLHTDNYKYQINKITPDTTYYRCADFYSRGCKAKIIGKGLRLRAKGIHICGQNPPQKQLEIPLEESKKFWIDYVSEKAVKTELPHHLIYDNLVKKMKDHFQPAIYDVPSKNVVYTKLNEIKSSRGGTKIHEITQPKLRYLKSEDTFLKRYWMGDIHGEYHQIVIWATEDSVSLLQNDSPTLIDCTFDSVPVPFKQCVLIMIFDANLRQYIPCVYAVVTGSIEKIYRKLFEEIIEIRKTPWNPREIATNCKNSLISAIQSTFNQCSVHILSFHFKKSIFKKAKSYIKNDEVIRIIISNIVLLTLLPSEEINRGIEYIRSKIPKNSNDDEFWKYFMVRWVRKYTIDMCNYSLNHESGTPALYDQAIEDYHKRLNNYFPDQRPPIHIMISAVSSELEHFCELSKKNLEPIAPSDSPEKCSRSSLLLSDYTDWKNGQNGSI